MKNPVVIVGMHRSGTSLVTRLLRQMGLFVGWELDANAEAIFFATRNSVILQAQDARWDRPIPVDPLFRNPDLMESIQNHLCHDLDSWRSASYLGPRRFLKYGSPARLDYPWGWKDPRNTLLLPLWLSVFPRARVVCVVRNGVDVSLSLSRRESELYRQVMSPEHRFSRFLGRQAHPPGGGNRLVWTWSRLRLRKMTGVLGRKYGTLRAHPCTDPDRGFALWEQYAERNAAGAEAVGARFFQLRFEELLADPDSVLKELAEHCQLEVSGEQIGTLSETVDSSARYRFLANTQGIELYRRVQQSKWMRSLGYDNCEVSRNS